MSITILSPFENTTQFVPAIATPVSEIENTPSVRTSVKKRRTEATKTAEDELFETSYEPEGGSQVRELLDLMERHRTILSVTRSGTKTMQQTFLRLQQLLRGEFLFAYTWDRGWFSKVSGRYPVESLKFENWDSLLSRIEDVLVYVEARQPDGFWYPSKRNGKTEKSSLADFLAKPMKSGSWWSPFIELSCLDAVTPRMYQDSLGPQVCSICEKILDSAWFSRDFETMVKFYKGVNDLKRWHQENISELMNVCPENGYNLSSFNSLMNNVLQCNSEIGCVGPTFIGPWSKRWGDFKFWMKRVKGVRL